MCFLGVAGACWNPGRVRGAIVCRSHQLPQVSWLVRQEASVQLHMPISQSEIPASARMVHHLDTCSQDRCIQGWRSLLGPHLPTCNSIVRYTNRWRLIGFGNLDEHGVQAHASCANRIPLPNFCQRPRKACSRWRQIDCPGRFPSSQATDPGSCRLGPCPSNCNTT